MLNELLNSTNAFDLQRQGYYDENSQCGFVSQCKTVKSCVQRVCAPHLDAFGGTFHHGCVLSCNEDNSMQNLEDYVCKNPGTAYKLYGVTCPGFVPNDYFYFLGREIKKSHLFILILIAAIIYIIQKRVF